ncbi:hypothetical protein [Planomicrobium okeanokoites]|uniref:hypothetical protein n=1 Tax=Planomicrobium okeanokoites TaxID=244 RepID=UPI002492B0DE|nr:hypothetical protein [Planomicrobium okeanokoites]
MAAKRNVGARPTTNINRNVFIYDGVRSIIFPMNWLIFSLNTIASVAMIASIKRAIRPIIKLFTNIASAVGLQAEQTPLPFKLRSLVHFLHLLLGI